MWAEETKKEGLWASLQSSAAHLLTMGKTRLSLLSNEIEEQKHRVLRQVLLAQAAMFCFALALILGILLLSFAFWEHRLVMFGLLFALFLVAALVLWRAFSMSMAEKHQPFDASVTALEEDIAALKAHLQENRP